MDFRQLFVMQLGLIYVEEMWILTSRILGELDEIHSGVAQIITRSRGTLNKEIGK